LVDEIIIMSSNLFLLSAEDRRNIELQRQASLLIYNMRKRKITRNNILIEIDKLDKCEQEKFKWYLNFYKNKRLA